MGLLLFYACAALIVSFVCSLLEAVLLSITPTHIAVLVKTGHRSGRLLKKMKDELDRSLAAILTFNTMAQTIGGTAVGAQAQRLYGNTDIATVSIALAFLMLFGAELMPKTIAVAYWKKLASPSAYLVRILVFVTYPIALVFEALSKALTGDKRAYVPMSREEVIVAAEIGQSAGTLAEKETRIIRNILRLNKIYVSDVMTPKKEVFSFWKNQTVADVMEKHGNELYSRIPVYDRDPSDIVGLVLRFNIFNASSDDRHELKMESLMTPIHRIRADRSLASAFDEFIQRREHLFLVEDASGTMTGLITLEDAVETLLGVEIEDEIDNAEEIRAKILERWRSRIQDRASQRRHSETTKAS